MDAECAPVRGADLGKWKGKEMSVRRGADLAKWKGKGMSKSGKKVVGVGSYSRKRVSRKKEKGKRKGQGLKSLFPRDLELYFPSPNVNFKGISDRDYNNWHPIKVEYPLQGRRNCFEIVKGKKLEKDVVSLLSNSWRRNYLVRNNGTKESVASCVAGKHLLICCFKVPLPDNHKDAHHCRAMIAAYNALRKKNENFEMVMVAKMAAATMEAVGGDAETAFNHFFDAFPCLAIPFWDTQSRDFLCRSLGLTDRWDHHAALLLDPDQVVLETDGIIFYTYGASGFPYTGDRLNALEAQEMETKLSLDFVFNNGKSLLADSVSLVQWLGSDVLLSRFGCGDTIYASELARKKCVMLYLCLDGSLMEKLEGIRVCEASKDRECEIVVIPVPFLWDTASFVHAVRLAMERKKLSSWWVMPTLVGDEEATHRLWQLCSQPGKDGKDTLFILSDGGKAVELRGRHVVKDYPRFEYPFTRISLANDLFKRLKSVKLETLLPGPCINSDGVSEPIERSNVLLYLDFCKNVCQENGCFYKSLRSHNSEINKDWKVVFASVDCNCTIERPGWLVYPGAADLKKSLTQELFPDDDRPLPALVAFGKDGSILSREARHLDGPSLFADTLFEEIVWGMQKCVGFD
ncbi:hypothetical protein OROHE_005959 [Orobanche hederae]